MISFKLRKKNHDRLTTVTGYLCLAGYLYLMGLATYTGITDSLRASRILDNPTIIQAPLALDGINESYRRRTGTTRTWRFRYSFEVDGTPYEDTFEASESNAGKYLDRDTIEIAFSRDTGEFEQTTWLEGRDSIPGAIWSIVKWMFISALLILLIFLFVTLQLFVVREQDRVPDDTDDAATAEDAAPPAKA
jgi:hypothetical protein